MIQVRRRSFQEDQKSKALAEASYLIKTFPKTVIQKASEFFENPETSLECVAFLETATQHRRFQIDLPTNTLETTIDAVTELHALGCARNNYWWYTSVKAPSNCLDFISRDKMLKGAFEALKRSLDWSKQLPPMFKWRIVVDLACMYVHFNSSFRRSKGSFPSE